VSEANSEKKPCILVVEDEPGLQRTLTLLLETEGFDVAVASNGVEALVILETMQPDIIITDYMMPRMDGLTFIALAREIDHLRTVPILLTSAVDISSHAGFVSEQLEFLLKPVDWSILRERIRRMIVSAH
jgi:DNA-binding response OmpR family regulator